MIGLSLSDTYRLTLEEFNVLHEEWDKYRTALYRTAWEQARFVAHCSVMPYTRRGFRLADIVRFEWDEENIPDAGTATREDFERIRGMFED